MKIGKKMYENRQKKIYEKKLQNRSKKLTVQKCSLQQNLKNNKKTRENVITLCHGKRPKY